MMDFEKLTKLTNVLLNVLFMHTIFCIVLMYTFTVPHKKWCLLRFPIEVHLLSVTTNFHIETPRIKRIVLRHDRSVNAREQVLTLSWPQTATGNRWLVPDVNKWSVSGNGTCSGNIITSGTISRSAAIVVATSVTGNTVPHQHHMPFSAVRIIRINFLGSTQTGPIYEAESVGLVFTYIVRNKRRSINNPLMLATDMRWTNFFQCDLIMPMIAN